MVENQEPLAPVSHLTTKAKIEITINEKGEFISATSLDKNREKIIIPVTEKSSGRTSGKDPCPHPLAEQLGYLVPYNTRKREAYLQQLQDWIDSDYANIKLAPIYRYINGGTILTDLVKSKIIKLEENGHTKNEKDLIRWIVLGVGENSGPCWTDKTLFDLRLMFPFVCEICFFFCALIFNNSYIYWILKHTPQRIITKCTSAFK